jgi:hypothetical protein
MMSIEERTSSVNWLISFTTIVISSQRELRLLVYFARSSLY